MEELTEHYEEQLLQSEKEREKSVELVFDKHAESIRLSPTNKQHTQEELFSLQNELATEMESLGVELD